MEPGTLAAGSSTFSRSRVPGKIRMRKSDLIWSMRAGVTGTKPKPRCHVGMASCAAGSTSRRTPHSYHDKGGEIGSGSLAAAASGQQAGQGQERGRGREVGGAP